MEFHIEYTGTPEQRTLIYREDEYSFDMEPWWRYGLDFEIAVSTKNLIHTLTLTVVDGKVIQLGGYCGLTEEMKANYNVPSSQKGELKVIHPQKYWGRNGCYSVNKEDWPVYVNTQTGWVCIGNPPKKGNAVEFINNCVAVIDDDKELVSLWLKPKKLPQLSSCS